MAKTSPIRPTDDEARTLGKELMEEARFGALAVLSESGHPMVTRIATALIEGTLVTLISDLSAHTHALKVDPRCSVLLGEPKDKGDPLTHPRITLLAQACFVDRNSPDHLQLRDAYLALQPKAKLYIDFADFSFVRFQLSSAHLNGGFGKAFLLGEMDLGLGVRH